MTVSWFRISVLSGSIVARTQQARQELMKVPEWAVASVSADVMPYMSACISDVPKSNRAMKLNVSTLNTCFKSWLQVCRAASQQIVFLALLPAEDSSGTRAFCACWQAMAIVLIQCPDMMSHSANTDKRWEWTGVTAPLTSNQSTYTWAFASV